MRIETVQPESPLFQQVKALWRKYSDTLGMMPDGGFQDYAEKQRILGLVDENDLCGYLMFRVSRNRAHIVHLCVAESHRGNRASEQLVDELFRRTQHLNGIELRCRRDFGVSRLWPKLGFVPLGERPGRAHHGSTLTVWGMDYGKPTLLTMPPDSRVMDVVIDANVLIDIVDKRDTESQGLCADWLQGEIRICITDEVFNDFNRQADGVQRARRFLDAENFARVSSTQAAYREAEQLLKPVVPESRSLRDESDHRHLIRAVAAGAKVFVSRDEPILRLAKEVYEATGLSVVRPSELISRLDELIHEEEYQPTLLAGTKKVRRRRVSVLDETIVDVIRIPDESKRDLLTRVRQWQAEPQRYSVEEISDSEGAILAVYTIDKQGPAYRVVLFRVVAGRLSSTLARAILTTLLREVVVKKRDGIVVIKDGLSPFQHVACEDLGFRMGPDGWTKMVIHGLFGQDSLWEKIKSNSCHAAVGERIEELFGQPVTGEVESELEHLLWPAKILSSVQHNFIVPIRPDFAQELFDERLANQTLTGADVDLALNSESVYYRSARQRIVKYPGRILWYVSDKGPLSGLKSIRACSRILDVSIDKPKCLFRRYQRLGVYEWTDMVRTTNGELDMDVMAIRFHDTELLKPVKWDTFQEILAANRILTNLESPVSITSRAFEEIYALAVDPS